MILSSHAKVTDRVGHPVVHASGCAPTQVSPGLGPCLQAEWPHSVIRRARCRKIACDFKSNPCDFKSLQFGCDSDLRFGHLSRESQNSGLKKTRPFRFLLPSEKYSFGLVHGRFLPFSVVVHLPKSGSQCEEPCGNYKNRK